MISVGACFALFFGYSMLTASVPPKEGGVYESISLPIKGNISYKNHFNNDGIKNDVPILNPSGEV